MRRALLMKREEAKISTTKLIQHFQLPTLTSVSEDVSKLYDHA